MWFKKDETETNWFQWSNNTWSDRPNSGSKERKAVTETFALSDRDREPRRVKGQGEDGIGVCVEVKVVRSEREDSHQSRLNAGTARMMDR